jgi:hypothetical protein
LANVPNLLASGALNQALVVSAFYWFGHHDGATVNVENQDHGQR